MGKMKECFIIIFAILIVISMGCNTKGVEEAVPIIPGAVGVLKGSFLVDLQITDANLTKVSVDIIGNDAIFNITYKMGTTYTVREVGKSLSYPDIILVSRGQYLVINDIQQRDSTDIIKRDAPDKKIISPSTIDHTKVNITLTIPYNQLTDSGSIYVGDFYYQQIEGDKEKTQVKNGILVGLAYQNNKNNKNITITDSKIFIIPS